MDTSDLHPKTMGEGASVEWLCAFIAIINTFRSLLKASDTFIVFQVLIKMADIHWNCRRHQDVKTGYVLRTFKSILSASVILKLPTFDKFSLELLFIYFSPQIADDTLQKITDSNTINFFTGQLMTR